MPPELTEEPSQIHDLTVIKGIGHAIQKWLREQMNVATYQDLAALSVKQLETRLREDGKITSQSKIEDWIAQAQELANVSLPEKAETFIGNSPETSAEWTVIATFVVEFKERRTEESVHLQTEAHYMQADKTHIWSGIEKEELAQWMVDQIGTRLFELVQFSPDKDIMPPSPPEEEREAPSLPDAPVYSDKLQQAMAAANRLTAGSPGIEIESSATTVLVSQPTDEQVYSGKLQQIIEKVHRLADGGV